MEVFQQLSWWFLLFHCFSINSFVIGKRLSTTSSITSSSSSNSNNNNNNNNNINTISSSSANIKNRGSAYARLLKRSIVREKIFQHIFSDYKNHERPNELTGHTTNVTVYIKILSVNSVNVIDMEYSADMYLRQAWIDPRLAWDEIEEFQNFTNNIVSPLLKEKVWLPDLFFRNGKRGYLDEMTLPNYLMRLKPNGEVLYSQKISMRFSCQMHLQIFPMDTQLCEMNIGSYGYTLDQLKFIWRIDQPIVLESKMTVSEFYTPIPVTTIDCTTGYSTATGSYSCLLATFRLQRQLGSYFSSVYIPSILIVMVSWLNFWVSIEAVPARITLGLLTLLGILTQATTVSANLPRVSYIKAVDIWIIACIIFVVGSLIEFVVASMINRRGQRIAATTAAVQQQQQQQQQPQPSSSTTNISQIPWTEATEMIRQIVREEYENRNDVNVSNSVGGVGVGVAAATVGGGNALLERNIQYRDTSPVHDNTTMGIPLRGICHNNRRLNTSQQQQQHRGGGTATTTTTIQGNNGYSLMLQTDSPESSPWVRMQEEEWMQSLYGRLQQHQQEARNQLFNNNNNNNTLRRATNSTTGPNQVAPSTMTNNTAASIYADSYIDFYSRFLFPGFFFLYNCCYWSYFMIIVNFQTPIE